MVWRCCRQRRCVEHAIITPQRWDRFSITRSCRPQKSRAARRSRRAMAPRDLTAGISYVGTAALGCPPRTARLSRQVPDNALSTIFAIKQIAHSLAPGGVSSLVGLPAFSRLGTGISSFFFAALRTPVRKPRLPRLQLKLFTTSHANFDRITHNAQTRFETFWY